MLAETPMFTTAEFIGIVLGIVGIGLAIFAIAIPLMIERWKRPHLTVTIENEMPIPGQPRRFLHGRVINEPHHILRWIDRNPAYDCRVVLTVRRDNQIIVGPMDTKWTRAPECITPLVQVVVHQEPPNVQINNIN